MCANLQIYVSGAAMAVLAGCFAGQFLRKAARRLCRAGLSFSLIAAGFLVSMATKPPADTNRYAIAYNDGDVKDAMEPQIVAFNQVTNLAPCSLTPPGSKRFLGWRSSIGNRLYDDGILIFNLASGTNRVVTLEAVWQ